MSTTEPEQTTHRTAGWLIVAGVVLLAFNLRPAAVSVGPVLADVTRGLDMSGAQAGVLTSLPVLAFALFGGLTPRVAQHLGMHRTAAAALVAVLAGLALRPLTDAPALFLVLSVLALSGMASANVILPSLIRLHFPGRVGRMTAIYTTALAVGLTLSATFTVPLSDGLGGWRWGLGAWAVAAGVALLPWLGLLGHDQRMEPATRTIRLAEVARTRLGWAMAVLFALQSCLAYATFGWFAQLYRDAGFSATTAGALLGLITAVSIPISLVVPALAARVRSQTPIFLALVASYVVGFVGLMIAPYGGALLWALMVGIGTGVFPVVLTLIGLRAETPEGTVALSGFTQSMGYLLAAAGPFGIGYLYHSTDGWTVPLLAMTALLVPMTAVSVYVARSGSIEEELSVRAETNR